MHKKNPHPARRLLRARHLLLATCLGASFAAAAAPAADQALRSRLRWVSGSGGPTLDAASRLLLARSAAERAGLHEVGLDFRDVYGVIHAESSWVPRTGMGKNGVASHGLAQFEPATARAMNLRRPDDAVEAVHAAARLLKEAAAWSARRIAGLGLEPRARAAKLREGVSVYYNLSTRSRNKWSGLNTASLPVETQRHIRNVHAGARQAERLHARLDGTRLAALPPLPDAPPAVTANAGSTPRRQARSAGGAAPARGANRQPLGTIEWAGKEGGSGPRRYVVWSDGTVQPHKGDAVPRGAIQWTRREGA